MILLLALLATQQFSEGKVTFVRGGKQIVYMLKDGKLETVNGTQTLSLGYWKDKTDSGRRVQLMLVMVPGPGTYGKRNIATLAVIGDGDSIFRKGMTDCTTKLTQLDLNGVAGSIACTGDWDDGKGGKGEPIAQLEIEAKK